MIKKTSHATNHRVNQPRVYHKLTIQLSRLPITYQFLVLVLVFIKLV